MNYDTESKEEWLIYDRTTDSTTPVALDQEQDPDIWYDLRSYKMTVYEGGKLLYLLLDEQLIEIDTESGAIVYRGSYEDRIVNLCEVNGELCLLDGAGNLVLPDISKETITARAVISTGQSVYGNSFGYTPISEEKGIVTIDKTGYLIDSKRFELLGTIDHYSCYNENTDTVYTWFYDRIRTSPLLSADDIIRRAKGILSDEPGHSTTLE